MNHKWLLKEEDTLLEPILLLTPALPQQQQILTLQTSNVTIASIGTDESAVDVIKLCMTKDDNLDDEDDEDKENSTSRQLIVLEQQDELSVPATSTISFHATNGTTTTNLVSATKLVLEKSSSISLFPAIAPTTPKVCRKMIYEDEADLKEIVKKYQTSCCGDDESVADCLVMAQPSLEIDKGITSC